MIAEVVNGYPLSKLTRLSADDVMSVVQEATEDDGVKPTDFTFDLQSANALFDPPPSGDDAVFGVYGLSDDAGTLLGIVALQPLALDENSMIEFMIFFRR